VPISSDYFKVPKEFLIGVISDIREDQGKFNLQIVLELTPLGETTPRRTWFNAESAHGRRSKWQEWLTNLRKLGVDTSDANKLIGLILKIELQANTFVNDEGIEQSYDKWIPRKVYSSESDALEDLAAMETPDVPGPSTEPGSPVGVTSIDPKVLEDARRVWAAVSQDEGIFRTVAASSWPTAALDELVKTLSS